MNIGQRVREAREALGMQRTVLARRVGVAENTIYRIETAKRTPSVELLEKIARELRTEPADLFKEPVPLAEASQETGRVEWEAAVRGARQLRERGWRRAEEALSAWRASKERGEAPDARHEYREEMGALLQQAYDAETALLEALADPLDLDEFAEVQTADWVYWRLRAMVTEGTGLSIREEAEHGASQDARPVRVDTSLRPEYPMQVFEKVP